MHMQEMAGKLTVSIGETDKPSPCRQSPRVELIALRFFRNHTDARLVCVTT